MTARTEERVAKGVALLDSIKPSWREAISLSRLDMGDGEHCVLGQLFGDYDAGVEALMGEIEQDGVVWFSEEEYGFLENDISVNEDLTKAWINAIT